MKKLIVLLALATFLFIPVLASAGYPSDPAPTQAQLTQQLIQLLEQTIAQLQQEIAAILAQHSVATTTTPAPTATPTSTTANTPLKGTLDLLQNRSYPNQWVVAPQLNFKLADFSLQNNTTEAINLKTIEVDLSIGSNLYTSNLYVTNLYLSYGSNKTSTLNTISYKNYWSVNFQLPIGQTIDLSVYGDVNSSIPINSTINSGMLVFGVKAVSATDIYTNSNAVLPGQNINFGTSSLSAVKDSSISTPRIVVSNQKVAAGKFILTANSDYYNISELKFIIPSSQALSIISDAFLSGSGAISGSYPTTQVLLSLKQAPAVYDGSNYILDFNVSIPISASSSEYLTLYYDLNAAIDSSDTNINVAPILAYVKAVNSGGTVDGAAANYNNIIASYKGITLPSGGVTVNGLYAFKSIPTFTATTSNKKAPNGSHVNLYTFSIAADPNGDISIKQLTFMITIIDPKNGNPHLTNFTFSKGNTDYTGSVAIGSVVSSNYIGLKSNGGIGVGAVNAVVVTFTEEEKIPAGTTQTYSLGADVNNFITYPSGYDYISTYVPSDPYVLSGGSHLIVEFTDVYYGLTKNIVDNPVFNYNLLWSDKSESFPNPHNDFNGYSTNDWYNGFEVPNLSLSAQTITAE